MRPGVGAAGLGAALVVVSSGAADAGGAAGGSARSARGAAFWARAEAVVNPTAARRMREVRGDGMTTKYSLRFRRKPIKGKRL
jgi:hypothetical protein